MMLFHSSWYRSFTTNFLIPGDTLMIYIDGNNIRNASSWLWMGKAAGMNREMIHYLENKDYNKMSRSIHQEDRKNLSLEHEAYKAARRKLWEQELVYFNKQAQTHDYSPGFKKWCQTNMEAAYYDDLLRYCWLRNRYADKEVLTQHPTYFSFLDSLDVTDKKYWISCHFEGYVSGVEGFMSRKNRDRFLIPTAFSGGKC